MYPPFEGDIWCVMSEVLDWSLELCDFKFQSCSEVHFRTNAIKKNTPHLFSPRHWIKYYHFHFSTRKVSVLNNQTPVDMPLNKESKLLLFFFRYLFLSVRNKQNIAPPSQLQLTSEEGQCVQQPKNCDYINP